MEYIKKVFYSLLVMYSIGVMWNSSCMYAKHHTSPLFIYSHGIAGTYKQAYRYAHYYPIQEKTKNKCCAHYFIDYPQLKKSGNYRTNRRFLINNSFVTFNYPDATNRFYRVNFRKTNLAQDNDINCLGQVIQEVLDDHQQGIILLGVSRGASTIINLFSFYKNMPIRALILESPFDSVETIIAHKIKKAGLSRIPGIHRAGNALMRCIFHKYKTGGIRPIDAILNIPKDMPILFICSQEDQLVPKESTIRLYHKLRLHNYQNTHLFVADQGKHGNIFAGQAGNRYEQVAHAFLKNYELPHNEQKATLGKSIFESTVK